MTAFVAASPASRRRRWLCLAVLCIALPAAANPFVPRAELWAAWEPHAPDSTMSVDHRDWQALLDRYLLDKHPSGIHRFDYARVSDADRARLDAYVGALAGLDPRSLRRAEQQAYWINLYNALTVRLVLEHYPVRSIRQIHGGLLNLGPWNRPVVEIAGEPVTLNDIEHRILRPIWRDPRVHYAVNCASLGCPNLAGEAFTADNTERLLEAGARSYVNHPRGARLDGRRLVLSSIYDWYEVDFGGDVAGVLEHLRRHADERTAAALAGFTGRVRYDYDWALNEP